MPNFFLTHKRVKVAGQHGVRVCRDGFGKIVADLANRAATPPKSARIADDLAAADGSEDAGARVVAGGSGDEAVDGWCRPGWPCPSSRRERAQTAAPTQQMPEAQG